ncbi:hypothetical protein GWK47_032410 [Chionoecetes opilio]|uniref:Uncharacterized protein n=1 Tax=Chionoecetes opilio TaxID=41210 RepID=A0A8J4YW44_CHIOP|nr:hypothetical protein GWK47_032410 [Chionoecetes opilio]
MRRSARPLHFASMTGGRAPTHPGEGLYPTGLTGALYSRRGRSVEQVPFWGQESHPREVDVPLSPGGVKFGRGVNLNPQDLMGSLWQGYRPQTSVSPREPGSPRTDKTHGRVFSAANLIFHRPPRPCVPKLTVGGKNLSRSRSSGCGGTGCSRHIGSVRGALERSLKKMFHRRGPPGHPGEGKPPPGLTDVLPFPTTLRPRVCGSRKNAEVPVSERSSFARRPLVPHTVKSPGDVRGNHRDGRPESGSPP